MKRRISVNRVEAYVAATVIFLIFFAIRLVTMHVSNGDPYVAFIPAAILSTFLLGIGPGFLTMLLGGLASCYYLAPPVFSFSIARPADLGDLAVYLVLCVVSCLVVGRFHHWR